ncbi:MAG: ROK family protein [Planctomycetota bacterium]|nr:ROK family protein [Planctomycetota bacterium]MDA1112677.1 ROK family protein [Planctomycetota bacterium]
MTSPTHNRIGIDLGGTNIKLGRVEDGCVVQRFEIPTEHDVDLCLASLVEHVQKLSPGGAPMQIGVGMPGVINLERSRAVDAPNLPFLVDLPLADLLSEACDCPVILENDANVAALGEARCGAGINHPDFLFVTLGTGVGGGLIFDGSLFHGPGGMAGEFGHLTVSHNRQCGCGALGCLEAIASARAMETLAAQSLGKAVPLKELAEAARKGDQDALAVFQTAGACLGDALTQVCLLLDLRVFLFGGGGGPVLDLLRKPALMVLKQRCFGRKMEDFQLLSAKLGNDAGLLGAAYLGEA